MSSATNLVPTSTPPIVDKPRGREVQSRKSADPCMRILERDTGRHVGWLYKWNTGAVVPMWIGKAFENVIYESVG